MTPEFNKGLILRDTIGISSELLDNKYGYPGGWYAMTKAMSEPTAFTGLTIWKPVEFWGYRGCPKRYYRTMKERKGMSYMMATYTNPPEKIKVNYKRLKKAFHK